MNYEENRIQWAAGSIVIHDADAKKQAMLMIVTGADSVSGDIYTRYVHRGRSENEYLNPVELLHDPARFDIRIN